jgi:tetratricopeptide (TPR) repeat protein
VRFRATLEMEPRYVPTLWEIGRTYYLMERYSESAAAVEEGMSLAGRDPILLMYAGSAYAMLGEREMARGIAAELRAISERRYLSPLYESHVLRALGEREAADKLIDRAYELRSGWLIFTRTDPIWDPLRAEPSYLALLKKLKLDF